MLQIAAFDGIWLNKKQGLGLVRQIRKVRKLLTKSHRQIDKIQI